MGAVREGRGNPSPYSIPDRLFYCGLFFIVKKVESKESCSGTTFLENQIGHQLQHSGSAGNAEERKIPPAWVTAGFFKR